MLTSRESASLDRYITGNYGEDQFGKGMYYKPLIHLRNGAVCCSQCGKVRNSVRSIQRHVKQAHK